VIQRQSEGSFGRQRFGGTSGLRIFVEKNMALLIQESDSGKGDFNRGVRVAKLAWIIRYDGIEGQALQSEDNRPVAWSGLRTALAE
jgi:hypothetical protein